MIDKVSVSSDTLQLWGINDIVTLKKSWISIENLLRLPPITKHTLKFLLDDILRCGCIRKAVRVSAELRQELSLVKSVDKVFGRLHIYVGKVCLELVEKFYAPSLPAYRLF